MRKSVDFEIPEVVRGRPEKSAMLKQHALVEIEGEFLALSSKNYVERSGARNEK